MTPCPTCNGTGVAGRILGVPVPVICIACQGSGRRTVPSDFRRALDRADAMRLSPEHVRDVAQCQRREVPAGHYEPEAGFVL